MTEWFDDFSYIFKLFSSGETVTDAVIMSRNNIANTTEHKLSTGSAVSAISAEAAETFRERSRRGKHGKGGQISDDEGDYQALSVVSKITVNHLNCVMKKNVLIII